jgi:hypothetical protein
MVKWFSVLIKRSKVAARETSLWARGKLLVSFGATITVRAITQGLERSRMTWAEIVVDLLIVIACYLAILALTFVWNFIFAPARLKREEKRKLGLESLNQALKEKGNGAVKALDGLMDIEEDSEESQANHSQLIVDDLPGEDEKD